ncbi:hypothetical protein Calag_0785 [Caldisphaera lagunensis DSM 15908]|uniref:Thioredoxin domain-containing protein n=1 Tax=Caldisphaera lagunensis (strain DSM 15908 / JCM 11604 / ANMR 0165 / IC-154) TaxID=1056495 RepID=L0ABM5_CALLD|nr:hypothetical protein [Caldisphaera lagunensis]AFZ70527.1 hypothetical protein Calag_0785 [Caldisphaera lagunensis DSM 15908]
MDSNSIPNSNGFYFFDPKSFKWVIIACDETNLNYFHDGVNIIYFSNNLCPACKIFNLIWYPFVNNFSKTKNTYFYVFVCEWFTEFCNSDCSRKGFIYFKIKASPTVVIIIKHKDKIVKKVIEGNVGIDILNEIVNESISLYKKFLEN